MIEHKVVACPACDSSFPSYEKFVNHVFSDHKDSPAIRMKGKVISKIG